jgi:hypothetical protein
VRWPRECVAGVGEPREAIRLEYRSVGGARASRPFRQPERKGGQNRNCRDADHREALRAFLFRPGIRTLCIDIVTPLSISCFSSSRSLRRSVAVWYRRDGSFASERRMTRARPGGDLD